MKKEYQILVIFLLIVAVSGAAIYMIGASGTKEAGHAHEAMTENAEQAQMPPNQGPDPTQIREHIKFLEDRLKSNPDDYEALVGLGNAYYDLGEAQPAIENYTKALKLHPKDAGVMVDMGAMYRQVGDADKAIELFNNAIQLDPQLPQAYFNLGMVLRMEKNDPKGAAKAWQKYLELDPNSQARQFLTDEIKKALEG